MSNIKSLIESKRQPENIIRIQEAKVKGTTFGPDQLKQLKARGFREMTRGDFLGFAGAPQGSWMKEGDSVLMIASPYVDGPHIEAYYFGDDGDETAQWSQNKGLAALGRLDLIFKDMDKAKSISDFQAAAKRNKASQVGY